jgi:hypothetical protein
MPTVDINIETRRSQAHVAVLATKELGGSIDPGGSDISLFRERILSHARRNIIVVRAKRFLLLT